MADLVRYRCTNTECRYERPWIDPFDAIPFVGAEYHPVISGGVEVPCGPVIKIEGPARIRLRRTKGWRKPEGAINVARPSKWGNPFKPGEWYYRGCAVWPYLTTPDDSRSLRESVDSFLRVRLETVEQAVRLHAWWLIEQPELMVSLDELRGHDLACWCALDAPCHADVLLELANAGPTNGENA